MHRFRLILLPLCLFADGNGNRSDRHRPHRRRAAATRRRGRGRHADARLGLCRRRGERPRRAVRQSRSGVRPYRLLFQHLSYDPLTVERSGDDAGTVTLTEATNARGRSGRPGRTPAGESRAGAPELRPPSRRTGQNRRQRLRSPHQTALARANATGRSRSPAPPV